MNLNLPDYARELFKPYRYKVLHGGRGSAKSQTIARTLLAIGAGKKIRVLCAREFQNSISESVHKLLSAIIDELKLGGFYAIQRDSITGRNGTEFIFKGVRSNVDSIKSMFGITHLWLEEAHTISKRSWEVLIPTIREEGSEIWVSYNPDLMTDPTHQKFVINTPPPDSLILKVNYDQNPWFPKELEKEKDYLYRVDPDFAIHVWGGECRSESSAQVFRGKWIVESFEQGETWDGPYIGADWGFANDPMAIVKMWIKKGAIGPVLMVEYEQYGIEIEINDLPEVFDRVPSSRNHKIRSDNSRPETISYVRNKGFMIDGCPKWAGSVEDGVTFLRSLEQIVIHPRCVNTINEFKNYSYKTDRLTGDITNVIVDKNNHAIDAIRYALNPLIQTSKKSSGYFSSNYITETETLGNILAKQDDW